MSRIDEIVAELHALVPEGAEIIATGQKKDFDFADLAVKYEAWYTKARAAVAQIVPERLPECIAAYREERRKDITYANYTVSDYLTGLVISRAGTPVFDTASAFAVKMLRQVAIAKAASAAARSTLRDIKTTLRAEIMDSDIRGARELMSAGYLRAAGVVAGVVLETHLASVCARRSVALRKKRPTITDLNDALKEAKVYDTPTWRLVQRLGDIRNLCAHSKDREPTPDEVKDLLDGTDKAIKEVF